MRLHSMASGRASAALRSQSRQRPSPPIMAVALSSLLSRSPRFHLFFSPNYCRLALLAALFRLHRAMTLEHRALVHDHYRRSEIARYLGRRANLDPLGGGDLAADCSRDDDRG